MSRVLPLTEAKISTPACTDAVHRPVIQGGSYESVGWKLGSNDVAARPLNTARARFWRNGLCATSTPIPQRACLCSNALVLPELRPLTLPCECVQFTSGRRAAPQRTPEKANA